jgi:hypothetical protein
LSDLKEKIAKILPSYLKTQIDKDKIRLWKLDGKFEELKNYLIKNQEEIIRSNKKFDIPELSYLECISQTLS